MQRDDRLGGRHPAVDGLEHRGELVAGQPSQRQVQHRTLALQDRQQGGERMAAVEVLGTERRHDDEREVRGGRQAPEQRDAVGVGPVQVLQHQHGRTAGQQVTHQVDGGPLQLVGRVAVVVVGMGQGDHRREQVREGVRARLQGRRDAVPAPDERLDSVTQQLVGAVEVTFLGLAGQDGHAVVEPGQELPHQAALADPRLAGDEGDPRRVGGADEGAQGVELSVPADHHRAQSRA